MILIVTTSSRLEPAEPEAETLMAIETHGTPVGVITRIRLQPGRAPEQLALFDEVAPIVREVHGCLSYELHPVLTDPDEFVIVEWWSSLEAMSVHDHSALTAATDARSAAFRDGPSSVALIGPSR